MPPVVPPFFRWLPQPSIGGMGPLEPWSVRSRAPWRPTLPEACGSFSTSAGVKYSRVGRSRLDCLRGEIAGEGVARDLGSNAFLLRPLERTFPLLRRIGALLPFSEISPSPNSNTPIYGSLYWIPAVAVPDLPWRVCHLGYIEGRILERDSRSQCNG